MPPFIALTCTRRAWCMQHRLCRLVPLICGVLMIMPGNACAADYARRGDANEGWLAVLRSLSAEPGPRRPLGLAGRASVEADHSLQVVARRLVAMLQAPSGIGA